MAIRTSVFSDDFVTDFTAAARGAAELGLDGLAVRNVRGRNIKDLEPDDVRRVRRIADDHGLCVSALGSPYGRGFFLDDDGSRQEAERLLDRMLGYADLLGTRLIRIFAPWLRGHDDYAMWSDRPDFTDCLDRLAEQLAPSVRAAERAGAVLMVETEGASHIGQACETALLLERLDSPALALCWDVANAWRSGETPLDGLTAALRLPVVDVHIKDLHADPADPAKAGTRRAVAGEGDVPYRTILPALIDHGYDGFLTVERNYHPRRPEDDPGLTSDVQSDIRNLRAIVDDIYRR
ncbi:MULTISPECIES: sugar phosphate isomerase/epimerase family protein [unclassified Streptomyces]|uniref:sugar phosphate isomerase/epimerase family protein n=1 Tax=unclassified Streptomyces TaxID=2593676 RepID=UPI002E2E577A|nr:sugar phosphate isomerase/epimerase [Streptomyces sp. NBC_00223]